LVTNGTFDTDTDWNKTGATTIASGAANFDGSSGTGLLYQDILTVNNVYALSFTISAITGTLQVIDNSGLVLASYTTTGEKTLSWEHSLSNGNFILRVTAGANTATVDNVSVREINPLSVSIQMDGRMTYADEATPAQIEFLRWYLNASNNIRYFLRTDSTLNGTLRLQQFNAVSDTSDSADVYSPNILVPYNIAGRHGSTFVNNATDGTAVTANTTPTALPDLSSTDLSLGYDYMGTIKHFRIWAEDIGDDGIVHGSTDIPEVVGLPEIGVY